MKEKNNWGMLLNPFSRIAGWQAFWIGLVVATITGIIGAYANMALDGVLDMHFVDNLTVSGSLAIMAIDIISAVLVMYLFGLFVSKDFRFVDILGTMTLSRAPYLLLSVIGLFVTAPSSDELLAYPAVALSSPAFMISIVVSIPVLIWVVALMYNGYRVSTGVRGTKLTIVFIFALLIAETVSKVLIYLLTKHIISL